MSILERSTSPEAPAAEERPHSDRLRVITAGSVGNMDARLATSGFDVVAAAETEDALIDAVSVDEPDAIVVEAELCDSLEHVRDLAPDAVLIAVGDHTPPGALGRVERGMSGTAMAGLLHALVAEGVGAAVVWGLVPTFRAGAGQHVLQYMGGSLLWAKADLVRGFLVNAVNACRDHAELFTAASTVAVTVSAGVLLTLSEPRTEERPARVLIPAPAVERTPQEPAQQHPVFAVSPTTPTSTEGPSGNESEPGDRRGQNRGDTGDLGRHDGPGENDQGEDNDDQGVNEGSDDQVVEDPHGQNEEPHGQNEDPHGQNEDPHGKNEDNDDQGENESEGDQAEDEDNDDQGENEGNDDQGENEGNDDQGEDTDPPAPL